MPPKLSIQGRFRAEEQAAAWKESRPGEQGAHLIPNSHHPILQRLISFHHTQLKSLQKLSTTSPFQDTKK